MVPQAAVTAGVPLARNTEGEPTLWGVLGAIIHLEPLIADDEARLEAANALAWDWIGSQLRKAHLSFGTGLEAAAANHLQYISSYPTDLEVPIVEGDIELQNLVANAAIVTKNDFNVALGGTARGYASPYYYRFWAEITETSHDGLLRSYSVLHLTVPEGWPLQDFYERVCTLVSTLRVRWASAGFGYSHWEPLGYEGPSAARLAHARRYPGYDIGEYVRCTKPLHERIRSINWLTFLGPTFRKELEEQQVPIGTSSRVAVSDVGDNLLVRAGDTPLRGDVNRRDYPAQYREVDLLLRPIRAYDPEPIVFRGDWDNHAIRSWLRRFELAVE